MDIVELRSADPATRRALASRWPAPGWSAAASWTWRLGRQLVVILAAVAAYRLVRTATQGEHDRAVANSRGLLRLEGLLGIDVERGLQAGVLRNRLLLDAANDLYIWGFWSIVSAALLLLFVVDRDRFRQYRNALFLSGSVGLLVFAVFPVAPPRMLDGFVDTVHLYSDAGSIAHPGSFTNVYAAVPSFHVGWLVLAGVATMPVVRRRAARPLLLLPALAMTLTVMATANHYLLDGLAGAAVSLGGLAVARRMPTLGTLWRSVDRRLAPYGGTGAVAARFGESVGRGLVPFIGGRAVQAYYSARPGGLSPAPCPASGPTPVQVRRRQAA